MLKRIFSHLAQGSKWRQRFERVVDVVRQWPWVYPRGIERDVADWISRRQRDRGWYASLRADWYEKIHAGGVLVHPQPATLSDAARQSFAQVATRRYPDASIAYLSGASLVGDQGMVVTPDNRVLAEYYHEFGIRSLRSAIRARPFGLASSRPERRFDAIGLLAAPQGKNYYHWIFDVLPRLSLLSRWRGVIDHYAVPTDLSAAQLESLHMLGVTESRLLRLAPRGRLRCEHLYAPSLPGSEGCNPPWVRPFLRDAFLPAAAGVAGAGPGLYVMRGSSSARAVFNETELAERLQRRGFHAVQPERHTFLEQIAMFRDARIVVSAHGAGLANLVFSTNPAVLELLSADYPRADCYFTLCAQEGHPYDCWLDTRKASATKPWGGLTADLDAIERKIDGLEAKIARNSADRTT